ncbi:MAG: hypothetical protein JWP85_2331 [Rhodoglobus sp.]|nr:hypothetical protein [Rhodoglobus sp.]
MATLETLDRVDGDKMYEELKFAIRSGEIAAGMPLREAALSTRFGVSRTPVREALNRLFHEGLLERRTRGLFVRVVGIDEVIQIYDLRILLEGEAASQAAESRRPGDLLRLEALIQRDRSLTEPSDDTRISTNLEFHAAIWTATNNRVLRDILERLATHLVHAPQSTLSGQRWAEALDEHEAIFNAIDGRDNERARRLAEEHMRVARGLRIGMLTEYS